jgi:hypothetical protein
MWPSLPYDEWKDTYATLHMWMQIVGKVALAQAPPINHSWGVAFHVTPRGLATRALPYGDRTFGLEFDLVRHELSIRVVDGASRAIRLEPQTVAAFYGKVMAALDELGLPVQIWTMPVEIPSPIPFEQDTIHHTYDPEQANRAWRVFALVDRALTGARCRFVGKCSPANFFWGSFDLAVTRFSGRPAPPREGPAFMRDAYSHEVISHGFWPGSGPVLEPAFYAYAVPQPDALPDARVRPDTAYYHRELGEFILPYEKVRTADDPSTAIVEFVDSTYDAAARLAGWDHALIRR